MQTANRLRELDFLRGLAIILVLLRHGHLTQATTKIGWIGVDLFFVLSGFLVSGLLFREFQKYGDIKPGLFLIRRGFKIYPVYYIFYWLYLIPILIKGKFDAVGFWGDMFFLQNYLSQWGWAYDPSWSLAVEEHFYFGFAMLALLAATRGMFLKSFNGLLLFEWLIAGLMIVVILVRLLSHGQHSEVLSVTMSHLRIDSMLAGVLVSCAWYFHRESMLRLYQRYVLVIIFAIPLLLSCALVYDQTSGFMTTYGFTLLYIGFALLLTVFLCDKNINRKLDRFLSVPIVNGVAKIGLASYAIYIIHTFVNYAYGMAGLFLDFKLPAVIGFLITSSVSVAIGWLITTKIEAWFLIRRDRFFPSRAPMGEGGRPV